MGKLSNIVKGVNAGLAGGRELVKRILAKYKPLKKYEMVSDVSKMERSEIYKHASKVFSAANKRIKRITEAGLLSPAVDAVEKEGGKFSAKGKDRNELLHEYARAVKFMNMKTSSLGGARTYEKNLENLVGKITPKKRSLLFDVFKRLEETNLVSAQTYGSDRLVQRISQEISKDKNVAIDELEKGTREYEEKLEELLTIVREELDDYYINELEASREYEKAFNKIDYPKD